MEGRSEQSKITLRREVEPPARQPTGLGVLLIASAAMFFAVAGSAFILRARVAGHDCPYQQVEPSPAKIAPAEPAKSCGQAVYRNNPDGSVTVFFEPCDK